jgi:hypothetical protein
MVRPDLTRWNQSLDDLLRGSIDSPHPLTRERYLALYNIASGQANASSFAKMINRENETVMNWVHNYNKRGPEALVYRRTGGSLPLFLPSKPKK